MNNLMTLDPTHVCVVVDEEAAEWGKEHGWIHSFHEFSLPSEAYEETFRS